MNNKIGNLTIENELAFSEDCLQVFIGIKDMSKQLQKQINEEITLDKINYMNYMKRSLNGSRWSKEGVNIISTSLNITVPSVDKHLVCYIDAAYEDKVDQTMWSNVSIKVNLAKHEDELKKLILNALIDKFF